MEDIGIRHKDDIQCISHIHLIHLAITHITVMLMVMLHTVHIHHITHRTRICIKTKKVFTKVPTITNEQWSIRVSIVTHQTVRGELMVFFRFCVFSFFIHRFISSSFCFTLFHHIVSLVIRFCDVFICVFAFPNRLFPPEFHVTFNLTALNSHKKSNYSFANLSSNALSSSISIFCCFKVWNLSKSAMALTTKATQIPCHQIWHEMHRERQRKKAQKKNVKKMLRSKHLKMELNLQL